MSQRQLPALVESLRTGGDVSAIQPTRIEVQSEDEIGELAQAFNDVEAVTLQVAQEQSALLRKGMGDLFVNLARRNQSLVQRQLELLDDLERNEHDPAALDALFKLDHMATRMRRNAESLLVLSGAEQPRQWQQPIALIDVVRAAAAEIADFPRVELVGIDDDLAVSGRAVSDVAHLLAELLENATSFSPPDTAVVVSGAVSATGFVLAVSDQGIGMPPDRIAEANKLLAKPPVVGLALSRALGLHVVGSLAARHGISVELRPGAPGGVVALVALPTAVLEPRPVARAAARRADRPTRCYAPDLDDRGRGRAARRPSARVASARRAAGGGVALGGPDRRRRRRADAPVEPVAPLEDARPYDASPTYDAPAYDATAPTTCRPTTRRRTTRPPTTRRRTTRRAYDAPPYDTPAYDAPTYDAPAYDAPVADAPPSRAAAAAARSRRGRVPGSRRRCPTRVPGQHLSHHPRLAADAPEADADPMRAYRVHELLTRHAQGKQRGQAGEDIADRRLAGAGCSRCTGGREMMQH